MLKETLREARALDGLAALYGMGSFFRGEPHYQDIDFLAVVDCPQGELLVLGQRLRTVLAALGSRLAVRIDLTVLTQGEFAERPLRDMDKLELLLGETVTTLNDYVKEVCPVSRPLKAESAAIKRKTEG